MNTVESLQNYLTRIACRLGYTYNWEADDILSEMNLFILEEAARNPVFLDQNPGYITRAAAWHAQNYVRSEVSLGTSARTTASLDDLAETLADETEDIEFSITVEDILSELGEQAARVARLIAAGFKGQELADRAEMSKQSISYYRGQIRTALEGVA